MAEATILMQSQTRLLIEFDPANADHREAYRMLIEDGKQHPTLRFVVNPPFIDAVTVMEKRLALHAVKTLQ